MEILLRYTFALGFGLVVLGFGLVSLVTFKIATIALEHQWVF